MNVRLNYHQVNPKAFDAMLAMEAFAKESGIDPTLYDLIKIRASQINGCSFCIDMHAKELQKKNESMERILLLTVWREVPIYTEKEKAVLELTEYVTQISESGVPQHVFDNVLKYVDEKQFVDILMAINAINCWNRLGISTGMFPGCFV